MSAQARMTEENKKKLIVNVIKFLHGEGDISTPDKKESIEVAIQCLESAYCLDFNNEQIEIEKFEEFLQPFNEQLPTEETLAAAEEFKVKGNDCMRNSNFMDAIEEYSRAIELNSSNAVYYCNRAAAYSRLENHQLALEDCKQAVKLDPTYSKAYGRLGIAYSHLSLFKEARDAYKKALNLDPTNVTYEDNLKLAEEQILSTSDENNLGGSVTLNEFMANPNLLNVASQMLNDPGVRNVMSGILNIGDDSNPNIDALLQMGQQLAQQMQINNPGLVDNLRRQFTAEQQNVDPASRDEQKNNGSQPDNAD